MFINGASLQCREDITAQKLLPQVLDDHLTGASFVSLVDNGFDVVPLSDIANHGNDIVRVVFFQPRNDDGRIETTGISEYDFFRHERSLRAVEPHRPTADKEWLSEHACGFPPARR